MYVVENATIQDVLQWAEKSFVINTQGL